MHINNSRIQTAFTCVLNNICRKTGLKSTASCDNVATAEGLCQTDTCDPPCHTCQNSNAQPLSLDTVTTPVMHDADSLSFYVVVGIARPGELNVIFMFISGGAINIFMAIHTKGTKDFQRNQTAQDE